ncbi:HAD-IA family hydrolase [Pannonibacter indicus]|uniref:Haloacid dehalogenase superfamily, subfamily IA, variant 3 with third motif having DD or ED/haloacid dehalogenase superfamily, subfamily IA, variant 1 with third motif having Dx(3-4)D or Dx(3-4)E n=1 Tax=Pannonibacter indicus TaxID=466044 RepID=A0A0K6I9V4_9HYPH|nr:HAD-IA family hydrolase [Pannonibacter indicus]CUA99906.1 haloacid dehalogenase superfamily, subfamily IA, variant 3 with third motif having DD or ED/haloacid dehalogenase superfamily, subfamily IA, variant 1 with third motif having Dx(3-4)D or Dx(3-4)E [Pannonibacter indicus]
MYLVIFDCDGTLIDSQETILHGLEVGFAAAGLPMPGRKEALSIVGLSLEQAFARLVGPDHRGKVAMMSEAYRASKRSRREAGLDHDPLYPGAREAILRLGARDDVLLGIATGKARRGVDHMLKLHDLEGRFITIQTADTSPSKPHPDMVLRAMGETGAEPLRTVMIGDTSFDMEMARAAGALAVGVSWGYHTADLLHGAGAHAVIGQFDEIDGAIARCLGWTLETL